MTSRRRFLGAGAAGSLLATSTRSFAARSANHYDEIEARVVRCDFKDLHRDDLPTPCMVVDLDTFEQNLRTMPIMGRAGAAQR